MTDTLLRFIHISDTHITPDTSYTVRYAQYTPMIGVDALIASVNNLPFTPDFVLHTGDVAYDPYPDVYDFARDTLARFNAPVYVVSGNHDDSEALQRVIKGSRADDLKPHVNYEADINGVQLVVVDSNGDAAPPAGHVSDVQLQWLGKLCDADDDRPMIVATHHNVLPVGSSWLDDQMRIRNGEALHAVLKRAAHRLRGVFHGHIHQAMDVYQDGILYASAASSWCQFQGWPQPEYAAVEADSISQPGYNIVSITRDRTYIRRCAFNLDAT